MLVQVTNPPQGGVSVQERRSVRNQGNSCFLIPLPLRKGVCKTRWLMHAVIVPESKACVPLLDPSRIPCDNSIAQRCHVAIYKVVDNYMNHLPQVHHQIPESQATCQTTTCPAHSS